MKLCLETAGSSLERVLKCTVYCTSVDKLAAVNAVYSRYFPKDPPARTFVNVPAWPFRFDIEIDCVAALQETSTAPAGPAHATGPTSPKGAGADAPRTA
jgi:2-iminobutanoate/2-iminopropanoate deaminase